MMLSNAHNTEENASPCKKGRGKAEAAQEQTGEKSGLRAVLFTLQLPFMQYII